MVLDSNPGPQESRGQDEALLTVVIPLYNGAATIGATLDSVQHQQMAGIEVIVVDDGSDDGGADQVRSHPVGATLLTQQHLGVAVARNRGLAATRSRWVAFLDQDDLWHPEHASRCVAWLNANPHERIVFAAEMAFSARSELSQLQAMDKLAGQWADVLVDDTHPMDTLITAASKREGDGVVVHHDVRTMLRGPISATTSFLADSELLRLAGGFAPHALAMDDYWLLVNVSKMQPIAQLDMPSIFYRVHVGATSRTTKLGLPFLSSAVALRLGGGLIPAAEGLAQDTTGKLHLHLLRELLSSSEYGQRRTRSVVRALADLLWPQSGRRSEQRRAVWGRRLPWLRQVRRMRGRKR